MGPVDPNGERFHALLSALGFLVVISVHKSRQEARFQYAGRDYAVCLDRAEELGWFAEIETIAREADVPDALAALDSLASELHLSGNERRSYLELLLEARGRD